MIQGPWIKAVKDTELERPKTWFTFRLESKPNESESSLKFTVKSQLEIALN